MKDFQTIRLEEQGSSLWITLNRPDKANAISDDMMQELLEVISDLRYNKEIKFVVFEGAGKHFSGGADLTKLMESFESDDFSVADARHQQALGHELMSKLEELEQVTITAIDGACIGGGLALALACDFRIMTEQSYISIPEVERGIFFTWGSTLRLIETVGTAKAKEMIILCEPVPAEEALQNNLVTKVVANDELTSEVNKILTKLDASPFMPIRVTKRIAYAAGVGSKKNLAIYEPELFEHALLSGEPLEEMRKFVNRKKDK